MRNKSTKNLTNQDLSSVTTYQAGVVQASAHRLLQKHCDDILMPYGITKMQWLIIGTVLDAGAKGIRLTELAEQLGTGLPYLTNTVNLLESKKILRRKNDGTDSRSKNIFINKRFIPKCAVIEETLRQELRKSIYGNIDPADFRIYIKVLFQLADITA